MPFRADGTFVPEDEPRRVDLPMPRILPGPAGGFDIAPVSGGGVETPTPAPAPAAALEAPAPGLAAAQFEPADASVATQLGKVLASDSPLLTQARTRAAQVANRRGLLNSSLAVQAGEAAAFDVALPIASQEAAQVQQRNLQGRQIASTEGLAGRELGSRAELQAAELGSRTELQAAELASREAVSQAGLAAQERIAASNIASFDRDRATSAVALIDNSYQTAFSTIAGNENIPAATREQYLTHLAAIRDTNFELIEQLYNIDLVWQSPIISGSAGETGSIEEISPANLSQTENDIANAGR